MKINIKQKWVLYLALLFYSFGILFSNNYYLIYQEYAPIFRPINLSVVDGFVVLLSLLIYVHNTPSSLKKPSDIIVVTLLPLVYVPSVIFSISYDGYFLIKVLVLCLSFIIITKSTSKRNKSNPRLEFNPPYERVVMIFYFIFMALFLVKFIGVMQFRGLDTIYEQRIIGKAGDRFDGYVQTYFGYVFSMAILTYGIYRHSVWKISLGLLGALFLYMVTAEKSVFMLPLMVYVVYKISGAQANFMKYYSLFLVLSGVYFVIVGVFSEDSAFIDVSGFLYLGRVVATPGIFFNQYFEYFSRVGYSNYSHITGLNLLFSPDAGLMGDPYFPSLGEIIARNLQGIESNSNASFIATDGVAAFGLTGVLIISVIVMVYFNIIDYLGEGWPIKFILPAFAPVSFILTNGSFFTVMLSFGGLFWMLLLFLRRINFGIAYEKI